MAERRGARLFNITRAAADGPTPYDVTVVAEGNGTLRSERQASIAPREAESRRGGAS